MTQLHRSNGSEDNSSLDGGCAFTGERVVDEHFVPTEGLDLDSYVAAGDLTAVHHLARYLWAREILPPLLSSGTVLDLGCGSGYGTFLLATACPTLEFLGADYDQRAIETAKREFKAPNLRYQLGDPADWERTLGQQTFGVVTCFDVLEHVQHRELLLEGLVLHLKPDGVLLFSTPCGSAENILNPTWVHHRIEFSAASLFDLLHRYFRTVLRSEDPTFPGRRVFEAIQARGVDYLLRLNPVICRDPILVPNPYR